MGTSKRKRYEASFFGFRRLLHTTTTTQRALTTQNREPLLPLLRPQQGSLSANVEGQLLATKQSRLQLSMVKPGRGPVNGDIFIHTMSNAFGTSSLAITSPASILSKIPLMSREATHALLTG